MALGAGEGSLSEGNRGGGGGLSEGNRGGGGGLSEGNRGGGGGLSEGNKGGGGGLSKRNMGGRSGDLAGADGEKGGLLEEGKGCSRQVPLLPDLHGILIPGPSAPSSTIDGVAPLAPIKIDFSRKERVCARILGGDGTPGFSKNSGEKAPAGGLRTRVRLFKGFRILPLGFKNSSQEEVTMWLLL
ncbi:heavy metal-associated isoprenylated plant protein 33-like [Sorghum bicolor]|uniref:heavy metal-associated isoprenylated plant protein 33-like n=1 Tax=Sorghum bicolor TaxID=4558 RepID=UPI000B4262FC|nr:heavy metal-associated isoprenylated plant protein 33-like [Sorghum bicolor]|eukprot:XP_021311807.1 heavy metal-associated isoprenylated plant protein 33-like [Sorghum bicolor]